MIGIYKITNKINGKCYIGQSVDIKRRFYDHSCKSHEHNRHLYNAMGKYGKENFEFEILEECPIELLNEREIYYIETLKPEYNFCSGGGAGRTHSEETKTLLREKGKEQWERMTEEERQTQIKNNLKRPPIGHPVSEETREKLRQANIGKKQSAETVSKRTTALKNLPQEHWDKTGRSHFKQVYCVETDTVYESVKACGEALGIPTANISKVLKGVQTKTYDKHFCYAEERTKNGSN